MPVLRVLGVLILSGVLVNCLGLTISDFDLPAEDDLQDRLRGLGIILFASLIAVLNEVRIERRKRAATARDTAG